MSLKDPVLADMYCHRCNYGWLETEMGMSCPRCDPSPTPGPKPLSERERVLLDGIELTGGDRNRTYGAPAPNLALQFQMWDLYIQAAGEKHSDAHDAAMQHVFAKIARIASGKRGHRDNYVDAATYIAIAYECDAEEPQGVGGVA